MSFWEKWLAGGVIVAAAVSWGNPRAWLWLALGVADYLITSAWSDLGLPAHPFFTAMVDASVCVAIYQVCHRRGGAGWELGVYTAFWVSVWVGLFRLLGNVSATQYALLLELANWLAILTIIGSGTIRLADAVAIGLGRDRYRSSRLHRIVDSAFAPARIGPWWWARGFRPTRG